jgi:endonuclease I
MTKRISTLACLLLLWASLMPNLAGGQYYAPVLGQTGQALKAGLHNLIKTNHTANTYASLWGHYAVTDLKPGGTTIWDIYSDVPGGSAPYVFTYSASQCSNSPNGEGICYNREHTWPATFFNDFYPMYADLFHVMPTDAWVNNKRNNFPYGEVINATFTAQNGGKLGTTNSYTVFNASNPNHWAFEPIDSFKGDVARNYFYMSTRYMGEDASWYSWEMANGANLTPEAVTLLLNWHHLDPVGQKEIDRNNAVFSIQGNRNPFIDYPLFADCIWGTADCTPLGLTSKEEPTLLLFPNPAREFICLPLGLENAEVRVTASDGTSQILRAEGVKLNIEHLPSGLFFISIFNSGKVLRGKIVRP